MIGKSFQQNPLAGLLELGLQIIGLPIVSIGLLIKAWAYKKFGQIKEEMEAQSAHDNAYTQYEEVKTETPVLDNNNLYASENKTKSSNSYDDLFE
ncbi:MAG: hypothetical protein HOP11_06680 [Saprospiraceae bacterium]|nr:hypothetical protein [Saprospiraceae bacterium]